MDSIHFLFSQAPLELVSIPKLILLAIPPNQVYEAAVAEFARYPDAIFIDVTGIKSKLMMQVDSFP
jgi:prephenate dehydrogenase